MPTVAVLNQKGGVGKTTVTLGLASAAGAAGRRVLVVDMDPQGSASWVLGVDPLGTPDEVTLGDVLAGAHVTDAIRPADTTAGWPDCVDVIPAGDELQGFEAGETGRLAAAFRGGHDVLDSYDAVLIDCPPSLGNLTTNALTAARHALLVVEPSALGLRGIGGVADAIDDVWDSYNPDLELSGVVLNRVPAISNEAERRIAELQRIVGRQAILKPAVPARVILNQAVGERRPIHSYASRAADSIDAFDRLWAKLRRTIKNT
ncbi:ParA family protein [Ilumatobacter sp.]|uniref:ParA family protein n=1 Tax=Ilumatobacter sp. TaxID=1967498 RepID=UPI003C5BD27B